MNKSDTIAALAKAMCQVQAEIENASKNAANPHFRSKYADLAEVLNTVRPVMSKHGISITQFPAFENGMASVETIVMHTSGEWMTGTSSAPVTKQDAQGVGSALTYLRRYSLAAIAGIAQEDDDGNSAVGGGQRQQQATKQQAPKQQAPKQQAPKQQAPKQQAPDPADVVEAINGAQDAASVNRFVNNAQQRGVNAAGMQTIQEAAMTKLSEIGETA